MDERSRDIAKKAIGITDEDLEKLSPGMKRLLSNLPDKAKWRIIAEVTESKYCFAGLAPGDKFVFNFPLLNLADSTAAPCLGAIAPLANQMMALKLVRVPMEFIAGIDRKTVLPRFHFRTFRRWFKKHGR